MQHCTACGTQVPDNARFCRNCGYILNPSNVDTVKVNPRKKSSKKSSKDRGPLDDLTTLNTHPLPDSSVEEREPVATAIHTDTPGPPETLPISEIPTSTLPDPIVIEAEDSAHEDEAAALTSSPSEQALPLEETPPLAASTASSSLVQPPSPPATKRASRSTAKWLIVALVCLLVLAAGAGIFALLAHTPSSSPAGSATPLTGITPTSRPVITPFASITPITARGSKADMTFFGAVSGHMTGINVVTCGAGVSTAGNTQYHVGLFGSLNGKQYAFAFNIYPYTHPDTYTTAVFSFFGPAGEHSSIAQWHSTSALGASVTVNSNGKSGILNIAYVNTTDNSTAQVVGSWTCA